TGGVNSAEAAIKEVPEYTGGVNSVEAAINEVPQYTLTTAGTNKDNTYQAPAVKTEDKKELPNTGGKDNVAVASLGFLGLFLGAIPFVKRKN
ncbi:neuraminidase, partial [Streptococcus mitis 13/39]